MTDSFVLRGESVCDSTPYEYRTCGLDGILLLNGFTRDEHDNEEYVTIKNIDGLHLAIGKYLVRSRKVLAPKEVRFLRNTMNLTQAELASALGKNSQSVARWEKGEIELPGTAEKLLRALFLARTMGTNELEELREFLTNNLTELDDLDEIETRPVQFSLGIEWSEIAAAA